MSINLLRHFERIDDSGANNKKIEEKWKQINSKNKIFLHNPYLSDKAYDKNNILKVINQIPNIQLIDEIICSPFLRCLQTSLIMRNEINQLKTNEKKILNIKVDFGLSEYFDKNAFYDIELPYNIMNVYNNSIQYLKENNFNVLFEIINPNPNIIRKYENCDIYIQRIKNTINDICEKFKNKNILLISHAYSYMIIEPLKTLKYYEPIKINTKILNETNDEKYKSKYLKYKLKYLKLKNKNWI